MNNDAKIVFSLIVGVIIGMIAAGFMYSSFESKACKDLEKKININLVYTFSDGCMRAEDM